MTDVIALMGSMKILIKNVNPVMTLVPVVFLPLSV